MMFLALSVAAFSLLHLVSAYPPLKQYLKDRIGVSWGTLFGTAASISLVMIAIAWSMTDFVPVYDPPEWGRHANLTLSFFAFLLFAIFLLRGKWRQFLRFPMALAILFWASGHLFANGDLASVIMFGGLWVYAVLHLLLGFAYGIKPTAIVHKWHDLLSVMLGVSLYLAMLVSHVYLIGKPVVFWFD